MRTPSTISQVGLAFISTFSLALLLAVALPVRAADQPSPAPAAPSTTTAPRSTAAGQEENQEPLVSLVLLLDSPRKPSHEMIAHAVSEGLGVKVSENDVVTKPPYHLVKVGTDQFIINDIDQPYFEQNAKVADEIKNPNLSRAVRDHRAWISVDWVRNDKQTDLRQVYQMIGKMAAHLSNKDTLAIYSPDMDQFALWAPTVRDGLESNDPLAVFEPADEATAKEPSRSTPSP